MHPLNIVSTIIRTRRLGVRGVAGCIYLVGRGVRLLFVEREVGILKFRQPALEFWREKIILEECRERTFVTFEQINARRPYPLSTPIFFFFFFFPRVRIGFLFLFVTSWA